ncbi:MAG: vWA domain-containing protein, partial [Planctomycetaceae bacterium]
SMNWRLIFSGAKSPIWVLCAVLSIVAVLLLSLWLMRLERRVVSRSVGWVLLSLRIAVLAVMLTLLLQPVLTTQLDVTKRGRVIVAVDASESMGIHDSSAPLSEKLRWAQALGMLGNQETDTLIQQWVTAAEAGEEPNWLGNASSPQTPAEQTAAETRKRQVDSTLAELAMMPRTEFVRRLLQSQPRVLLEKMQGLIGVDLRLFATAQKAANTEDFADLLQSERIEILPGNTDVLNVLQSVTQEDDASEVRAVVLLTDGRQSVPGDLSSTTQLLSSLNVPVYTIPIGSKVPPRDLSVIAVDAPEAIFLNDKAQIQATLATFGFEGQKLTVRLERDGKTLEEKTLVPSVDSATATFTVPSGETGRFDYRIVADPQRGELRDDNNARDLTLHVVDNKARVMLLDGDPRWEFRYLKNLLERDKQVDSRIVLFRQPFLNLLDDSYIASKLPPVEAFATELAKTDLLIIGDVLAKDVESGVWELIEMAVSRDGLSVVIIPGRQSMPHGFQSEVLSNLLPVKEFTPRVAEQFQKSALDAAPTAYRLRLTTDAFHLPMFQLSDNMTLKDSTLTDVPGHPWIYGGVPKAGATLWADSSIQGDKTSNPLFHHDYGFGQVVWMGISSTWRWRMRSGMLATIVSGDNSFAGQPETSRRRETMTSA